MYFVSSLYKKIGHFEEEKGIPDFWLNALKMAEVVQDMIQEHDEPILKYLKDITTTIEVSPPVSRESFADESSNKKKE